MDSLFEELVNLIGGAGLIWTVVSFFVRVQVFNHEAE